MTGIRPISTTTEEQAATDPREQDLATSLLAIDVEQLAKTAPLFSEWLEQVLKTLDDPMAWLKISNLRLEAQSLWITFNRIDGLLATLESRALERERTARKHTLHGGAP